MARNNLPQELIDAGQQLLATTDALDMQAQGAMWIFDHVLQDWRFYLVTSLVDTLGRRKTYGLLLDAFESVSLPRDMTIEDVHLGSPSDELFRFISSFIRAENGVTKFENCMFNNMRFDGVIYRSVVETPTQSQSERIQKRFSKRVKDLFNDQHKRRPARV
jgi:hypothetical protein